MLTSIGFLAKPLGKTVEMQPRTLASFGSPSGFSGNQLKKPILVRGEHALVNGADEDDGAFPTTLPHGLDAPLSDEKVASAEPLRPPGVYKALRSACVGTTGGKLSRFLVPLYPVLFLYALTDASKIVRFL